MSVLPLILLKRKEAAQHDVCIPTCSWTMIPAIRDRFTYPDSIPPQSVLWKRRLV